MTRKHTLYAALVALMCSFALIAVPVRAQFPRTVNYQGVLQQGTAPVNGNISLTINYYNAETNVLLASETFSNVPLTSGVFSIQLGSTNIGVASIFDAGEAVTIGVQVNGGAELPGHTALSAAPYAFTSYSLLGVPASLTPVNNTFFPLPVDGEGHIGTAVLPTATLNGQSLYDNDLRVTAGRNVTVTTTANGIKIDGPATPTITTVAGGTGIATSQSNGTVTVATNADLAQFTYQNSALRLRTDIPVIGTDAHFRTLEVLQDGNFGGGVITNGLQTGTLLATSNATIRGDLTTANTIVRGDLTVDRDIYSSSDELNIHASSVSLNDTRLSDLGDPLIGEDAANKAYVDSQDDQFALMNGDVSGTTSSNTLNVRNEGVGDRVISAVNRGSTLVTDERVANNLTVDNGVIRNTPIATSTINSSSIGATTPSTGKFSTLTSLDQTLLARDGGRVGIGTSTPSTLLNIRGNTNDTATVLLNNNAHTSIRGIAGAGSSSSLELRDAHGHGATLSESDMTGLEVRMTHTEFGELGEHLVDQKLMTIGFDNIAFSAYRIDCGNVRLERVRPPIDATDAANKAYVDTKVAGDGNLNLPGELRATNTQYQQGQPGWLRSDRFADFITIQTNNTTSVVIYNSLVKTNSVILVTAQTSANSNFSERTPILTQIVEGAFVVNASGSWQSGDRLYYMIVN